MPSINLVIESPLSRSPRVQQLSAMFDVPVTDKCRLEWHGELPIEADDWNVGLIVGPSGCGKSTIAREVFGQHVEFPWDSASVIDDFPASLSIGDISTACQSVGFNTIPAWMRPYNVLSTGEKFRVDLARRMLELPDPIVCDEFTSVVDRQVAKIGAHAVQKAIRRDKRKFIAVSCHYDIIDWLQPDWILEPATMTFTRRSLRRKPSIDVEIVRVSHEAWQLFSRYHYLTNELSKVAACYVLLANGHPASFAGLMPRPHPKNPNIIGVSRNVTLPDWQGLGLAFVLCETLGAALKTVGKVLHHYPAHPSFIRSLDKSPNWEMIQEPGNIAKKLTGNHALPNLTGGGFKASEDRERMKQQVRLRSGLAANRDIVSVPKDDKETPRRGGSNSPNQCVVKQGADGALGHMSGRGNRPCAVFRYAGPAAADKVLALRLLNGQ